MPKKRERGRPAVLKKPMRRNISLEESHWKKLERYARKHSLSGRSAALRQLIEDL